MNEMRWLVPFHRPDNTLAGDSQNQLQSDNLALKELKKETSS